MRFVRPYSLFVAVLLLSAVMLPVQSHADTRNIHGLNFSAEKIERADGSSVLLTLFGHTVIVKEGSVNDRIVDEYVSRPDFGEKFERESLENFTRTALSNGDARNASKILLFLLSDTSASHEKQVDFLASLERLPGSLELFAEALKQGVDDKHLPISLLYVLEIYVGQRDMDWVKLNVPVFHERDSAAFEKALADLFVKALKEQRKEDVESLITFARRILGPTNSTARDLKYISEQSQLIDDAAEKGDVEKILPLLEVAKSDELMQRALGVYLYEQLHQAAKTVLQKGQPEKAIKILSHIKDEGEWTPQTFSIVLEALQKLTPEKKSILLDPSVAYFLQQLVKKDNGLKHYLIRFLEGHIKYLARNNESLSLAEDFYEVLTGMRPASDPANDSVKFALAMSYLKNNKALRARDMIEDMTSGPGIWGRLRLLFSGYYVNTTALIFLIILPLIIFIPAILKVKRLMSEADEYVRRQRFVDGEDEDRILSQAKSILDISSGMHPRRIEYQELLSVFDLDDTAEEKEIKASYRAMIKKFHPDIQSSADVHNSEKFIEITTAYERIMELRKLLKL